MPAHKDKKRNTWTSKFTYTDWMGAKRTEYKRGFRTKGEAAQYEKEFLEKKAGSCNMPMAAFIDIYMADMANRLRPTTMITKRNMIDSKIIPYFGQKPINEVKPTDVRQWQNKLMEQELRPTYLRTLHNQLSAIFNYAVRFYDLPQNPCRKAGTIGSKQAETIDFWTLEEYNRFIPSMEKKPRGFLALEILYWAGLRVGELMALTPRDFLRERMALNITKTYDILEGGEEYTGPTKNVPSTRIVSIPPFLGEEIERYLGMLYKPSDDDRIFEGCTADFVRDMIDWGCKETGVKRIRVHDLRHSHVSLLIHLGYSLMMIAQQIGHSDIKYITETYGHLYPSDTAELVGKLEEIKKK